MNGHVLTLGCHRRPRPSLTYPEEPSLCVQEDEEGWCRAMLRVDRQEHLRSLHPNQKIGFKVTFHGRRRHVLMDSLRESRLRRAVTSTGQPQLGLP